MNEDKVIIAKLKETEDKFSKIFHLSPYAILISRPEDGKIIDINDAFTQIYGYTREESINNTTINLNIWLDLKDRQDLVSTVKRDGEVKNKEYRFRRKNGDEIVCLVSVKTIMLGDEKFLISSILDVTKEIEIRKKVLDLEEDFKLIFENMVEGLAVHEMIYDSNNNPVNYRIDKINKAYELYTGITAEKAIGKIATELYGTPEAPYLKEYSEVIKTKKPLLFETFFPPMNKWFFITVISPKENQFVTIFQDITERKKTEENLLLKNIVFDKSITAMVISDPDFNIFEVNNAFCELGNYPKNDIIGKRIDFFFANKTDAIPVLASVALNGAWEGEVLVKKKDGTEFTVYGKANVLKDKNDNVIGYEASVSDIDDRKKLEEKLMKNKEALEEAQKIAGLGNYVLDVQTNKWTSSKILDQIFGIDKNFERSINNWANLVHPEDRDAMLAYFTNEVIGQHKEFNKEYRIIKNDDKSVRWVLGLGKLKLNNKGEPMEMFGTIQDITEQKNKDAELKTAHENLQNRFNELEKLNQLMIGRELTMVEMKEKISKLEKQLAEKK